MKKHAKRITILALALSCAFVMNASTAFSQGLLPPQTTDTKINIDETHPALKMTPDKSEIVNLDTPAASIIVGNPQHVSVAMDSAQRLIVTPLAPGATYMSVLDGNGSVVMQRHILVAAPKQQYLRIRRTCNTVAEGCEPTSVYYCPEGLCHQVSINEASGK